MKGKEKYDDPADTVEKKWRGKDVFFGVSSSSVKRERIQGDSKERQRYGSNRKSVPNCFQDHKPRRMGWMIASQKRPAGRREKGAVLKGELD